MSDLTLTVVRQDSCEYCEGERNFVAYRGETAWCEDCGLYPGQLDPRHNPGGCPDHPNATHEDGFGLAGGGYGSYSVCNECGRIFDFVPDHT